MKRSCTRAFLSLGFLSVGWGSAVPVKAQTVMPVRVGSYVNTRLFNTPESILEIVGTNGSPFLNTVATFQSTNVEACYRINPASNDTLKRYPNLSVQGSFIRLVSDGNSHLRGNSPITSAGLLLATSSNSADFTFLNVATGAFSSIPYRAQNSSDALVYPYALNGKALIWGNNGNRNTVVIATDGTPAGTTELTALAGSYNVPTYLGRHNGKVYLSANASSNAINVFETDGTQAGTRRVLNGTSPTASTKPYKAAFSAGFVCYTDVNGKLHRWSGDTASVEDIVLPFPPSPIPSIPNSSISDVYPAAASGKFVVAYSFTDYLAPANSERGLGVVNPGGTAMTKVANTRQNSPARIELITQTRDNHFLMVPFPSRGSELFVLRSTLDANNMDTLRLSEIGAPAGERIFKFFEWDARLLLITTQSSTSSGTLRVTDGTVAGSSVLHGGQPIEVVTVDEQGVAWHVVGREFWRLNGLPFVTTKPGVASQPLQLAPNPAHNVAHVAGLQAGTLSVYDAAGRQVYVPQRPTQAGTELELSTLQPGVYAVRSSGGRVARLLRR